MRVSATQATSFNVKSNPENLERFETMINNDEFNIILKKAVDGDSKSQTTITNKLMPFLRIHGAKIKNGKI